MSDSSKNEITGTIEDLASLKDFWTTFECELPEGGYEWVDERLTKMDKPLTKEEQKKIQFFICFAHCTDNEVFKDPLFDDANKNSREIAFNASFDNAVTKEFSDDDKDDNEHS